MFSRLSPLPTRLKILPTLRTLSTTPPPPSSSSKLLIPPILLAGVALGFSAALFSEATLPASMQSSPMGVREKTIVTSKHAPAAIGPYSHGNKANGFLFVSGCIGLDEKEGKMVEGGVEGQAVQALKNLVSIIESGGCRVENVVKTTVLLSTMDDYAKVNKIYAEVFGEGKPARIAYAVKGLPAGALVEIDAVVAEQ